MNTKQEKILEVPVENKQAGSVNVKITKIEDVMKDEKKEEP